MSWAVRGSNPDGGEIFRTCPDRPWGPPSLLYNGYRVFLGGKERQECNADPSPPSSAVGHERVELYLYSPYGPYGLYRASVPVHGWPLPLPTYFVRFYSPSSGGKQYVYNNWYLLFFLDDSLLFWLDNAIQPGQQTSVDHNLTLYRRSADRFI